MSSSLPGLWVFEALSRAGTDVPAIQRAIPEAVSEVLRNQEDAHPDQVGRVLEAASVDTGDANIGLRMNRLMTLEMLGPFGFVLLNAPTVGRFLHLTARYYPILYRGARFEIRTTPGGIRVQYSSPLRRTVSPRHLDEWSLGFLVDRIRQVAASDWSPLRASMQYAQPSQAEEVYERFGPGLRFGSNPAGGVSWFECQREVLDLSIDHADDGVLGMITDVAEASLEEALRSVSFSARAEHELLGLLRSGSASAEALARHMSMSVSTLKRRLAAEGSSYRELHSRALRACAKELLLHTDLHIGRIARQLGYSDISSFDHAFRRVFGTTPSEYRAQAGHPG